MPVNSRVFTILHLVLTSVLFLILGLALYLPSVLQHLPASIPLNRLSCGSAASPSGAMRDISSSTRLVRFRTVPVLEDLSTSKDAIWRNQTSTSRGGFLWMRDNASDTGEAAWGVSMFHALHCLGMLREALQQPVHLQHPTPQHSAEGRAANQESMHHHHTSHCLGYIAQSLLCSADGTLEGPRSRDGSKRGGNDVDGEGVLHQCKDASLLWNVVQRSEVEPLPIMRDLKDGETIWSLQANGK